MRYLILLLLGAALGAGAYWYFTEGRRDTRVQQFERQAGDTADALGQSIKQQVASFDVAAIREELTRTGKVIRQKAGAAVAVFRDDGMDAKLAAAVKARLAADPALAGKELNTAARQGTVTLTGGVTAHEEIARAMQLTLQVEGVREVVSELQLRRAR